MKKQNPKVEELLQAFTAVRHQQEMINQNGEYYNVFFLLDLARKEASLHSKMIADLLQPDGWHGQKDIFLKLFLQELGLGTGYLNETAKAEVIVEDYIGPINADNSVGGSIDLVIKFPTCPPILIENKIDAYDQHGQLYRYKSHYRDSNLYYLTLAGTPPSANSVKPKSGNYVPIKFGTGTMNHLISYNQTILSWLRNCVDASKTKVPLYGILNQYIDVVETITNQTKPNSMSKELTQTILSSKDNLHSFFDLIANPVVKSVEQELMLKFVADFVQAGLALGLNYDDVQTSPDFGHSEKGSAIWFTVPGTQYSLSFGFDKRKQDASIGIHFKQEQNAAQHTQLRLKLAEILGEHHEDRDHPEWQYLIYLKKSKRADKYLDMWSQGNVKIWGGLLDGSVAQDLAFYLRVFLEELAMLGLTSKKAA